MTQTQRNRSSQRGACARRDDAGNAVVELAVVPPLLLLLALGAFDFGRVFYLSMAVTGAAHAGALYGAQPTAKTADSAGMSQAAEQASPGLGITATASQVCRCATGAATVACSTTTSSCLPLRIYASVTSTATFVTV